MSTKKDTSGNINQPTRVAPQPFQSSGNPVADYIAVAKQVKVTPETIKENSGYIRDANGNRIKLNDPPKRQTRGSFFSLKQKF